MLARPPLTLADADALEIADIQHEEAERAAHPEPRAMSHEPCTVCQRRQPLIIELQQLATELQNAFEFAPWGGTFMAIPPTWRKRFWDLEARIVNARPRTPDESS